MCNFALPEVVGPITLWWEGLCVSVILRAMSAGAQAPGRSNQAVKVEGERPD
jgi:hypothetical protein